MASELEPPTPEPIATGPSARQRRIKWSRERRRRFAAMGSGAMIAAAIGFAIGRWSVAERPVAIAIPQAAAVSRQPIIETEKVQQEVEAPLSEPFSLEEEKLIEAIARTPQPARAAAPRRPKINLQQIGSVGYFVGNAISVTKVIDSSTFIGTTTWRSAHPDGPASEEATYIPNSDARYTILFRGVPTFALHDEQVLLKDSGGVFDKAFVTMQPTRTLTAVGTRTFLTVMALDDTRVRALTVGKSSQDVTKLLNAIGRHQNP